MRTYVLPLADPSATLDVTGGKGASLSKLANAGLPVPGGFHVTTTAYKQFVADNDLQPRIAAALQAVDVAQPTTLETASEAVRVAFLEGQMPAEIAGAIAQAYAQMPGVMPFVAVRSSATAEDLPDLSFAGQQETFLNIQGVDAVLEAVQRCWASLWTARAIGYRVRHAIDQDVVSLAVVVQALVPAEVAGIMFTANPLNGRRDQAVVNAAWGLGEAVVGGLVTPDTFTVDKARGVVVAREIADKETMTARVDGGTLEQPVAAALRRAPSLSDAQVVELVCLGADIETLYGMPMDIEWTLVDGAFAIVQARPITALPPVPSEPAVSAPSFDWTPPAPKTIYSRTSIAELLPDPLTPLYATLGVRAVNAGTLNLFAEIVGPKLLLDEMVITINGYAYYQLEMTLRFWLRAAVNVWSFMPKFFKGEMRWRDEARPQYQAVIDRWQARPLDELPATALLDGAYQLAAEAANLYNVYQSGVIGQATSAEMLFTSFYEKLVRRKGEPPALTFMLGGDSMPIRAEKSLYDLAQWCRTQSGLSTYLASTPGEQVVVHLAGDASPETVAPDVWQDWRIRLGDHLAEYGHAVYNLDFAQPVPADDPAPLLETLRLYIEGRGANPHERQREQRARREAATQALTGRLKGLRLKWFRTLLGWVQKYVPMREDTLSDVSLGYPLLRRMARELGRRLVAAGTLAQIDDVFWLAEDEARDAAVALDRGEARPSAAAIVAQRKVEWQAAKRVIPPLGLPERAKMTKIMEKIGPVRVEQESSAVIKGVAASPGQVTAPACVLHGPEDFDRMKPGAVLVAAITTPAWTPLFAMASAIVTDVGGPLSHGSIVAREYGIPAVLGTGTATKRILDGQTIAVDGSAGEVTLDVPGAPEVPGHERPIEWKPPHPKGVYMRGSVVDLMPDPLSPLFVTMGIGSLRAQMQPLGTRITGSTPFLPDDYFTTINNYAYMNTTMPPKALWWILTGMLVQYPRLLKMLVPLWRDEMHPEYQAFVARQRDKVPGEMSPGALWHEAQATLDAAMTYVCALMFATMGASAGSELLLTKVYDKLAKQEGDPPATTLLMGWDNIPVRAEKSLYDLAMWCGEREALAAHILTTPSTVLASQLNGGSPPSGIPAGVWQALQARFARHLDHFGHVIFQLDFAEPLPRDHPEPMLENVKMYLRGEGVNPHERQRASEERRVQTAETMLNRLKGLKLWAFRKALRWGQSMAEVREDALAEIGLGYPVLRGMLHELGRRVAAAGAIRQDGDIFFLEKDEIDACVARLEQDAALDDFSGLVAARRAFVARAGQVTPPPMIPMKKRVMGVKADVFVAASAESQTGDTLKGVAASAGQVTAPACVLGGPEDFGRMQPGDVLVAGTTTPAWTPLFAMASAVVTDIGGPLSHGSIVAREYGIPAVMGTGVATRRIRNGQVITVDGGAGVVRLGA